MLGHIKHATTRYSSVQVLLLELRTLATSIASEASLLVQREANHSKKIVLLEDNQDKMISTLEHLERDLRTNKVKEREYLTKLEQMEADLARFETLSQSQEENNSNSPEMVQYRETRLQIQTSESQIYRGLLERVLQVVPSNMSSLVSDLTQNLIHQATLSIEEQFLNMNPIANFASDKDWQDSLRKRRETIKTISKRQAVLRSEMEDLEKELEVMLSTNKISQKVILENQKKNEDLDMAAMRLTRPTASYLHKQVEEKQTTPTASHFYKSEQFGDSKTDFAMLKSKIKEIKSKLI